MAFEMKQIQSHLPVLPYAAQGKTVEWPFVLLLLHTSLRDPCQATSFQYLSKNFLLEQSSKYCEDETTKGGVSRILPYTRSQN